MTTTPGSTPDPDPLLEASEGDVAEQQQAVDGESGAPAGEAVTDREAAEADALEQGAPATTDDEAYPRAGEAEEGRLT